jgi:hypothetical protein
MKAKTKQKNCKQPYAKVIRYLYLEKLCGTLWFERVSPVNPDVKIEIFLNPQKSEMANPFRGLEFFHLNLQELTEAAAEITKPGWARQSAIISIENLSRLFLERQKTKS